jgi:hypothetical protein
MSDTTETTSIVKTIRAILHGGPESIANETRIQLVGPLDEKIKLPHYGGYEHFERISATDDTSIPEEIAFRWTMRTEMAE